MRYTIGDMRKDAHMRKGVAMIEIITSAEFEQKVLNADVPVLVDYFATWCGPCQMLAPALERVAAAVEGKARVYKVDIDASPDLAVQGQIMAVPTLNLYRNGEVAKQLMGLQSEEALMSLFS